MAMRTSARVTALLLTAVVLSPVSFGPSASAAGETFCTKYGWAKATQLSDNIWPWPDTTWAEVREQGSWGTSGWGKCYGRGLYDQRQNTDSSKSYCYWNSNAGAGAIANDSCLYFLSGTPWWNDGTRIRFSDFTFKIDGGFSWVDPSCISPCTGGQGRFDLIAKFTIGYDGTFSKTCSTTGKVAPDTYRNCAGGTG